MRSKCESAFCKIGCQIVFMKNTKKTGKYEENWKIQRKLENMKTNWKKRQTLPEQQEVASSRVNWLPFRTSSKGCHHKLHLYQLIVTTSEQELIPYLNKYYNIQLLAYAIPPPPLSSCCTSQKIQIRVQWISGAVISHR